MSFNIPYKLPALRLTLTFSNRLHVEPQTEYYEAIRDELAAAITALGDKPSDQQIDQAVTNHLDGTRFMYTKTEELAPVWHFKIPSADVSIEMHP